MTDEKILASKRKRAHELDTENGEVYDELRKGIRGFVMDTTGMRQELLINWLKANLMTEEAALDFEIEFHTKVKDAMAPSLSQLQTVRRREGLTVVKDPKKAVGLVDGHGRPLKT